MNIYTYLKISLLSFFCFFACQKEENPVPITYVNYTFQGVESDPQFHQLRIAGYSIYLRHTGWGYNNNGLIIYRYKTEGMYDDFRVYDATCPHEVGSAIMEIDKAFPDEAVCPQCGSRFSMHADYMLKGPARHPLRALSCSFINGDLYVY